MSAQDQETAEAERLAAVARQINAGHIPDGVTMHTPGGQVIAGPAEPPLILEEDDLSPRELRQLEDWEAQEHLHEELEAGQ